MSFQIIDTHVHVWDLQKVEYAWLKGDESILNRTYLLDELNPQIQLAGVSKGVLVQAANNLEDTFLMLEQAEKYQWIHGVVGWLPLMQPDETARIMESQFSKIPLIKGIRHLIHNEADPAWLLQDKVIHSLSLLSDAGLTYDLVGIHTEHIETALKLANKAPGLKMVFDHLNQPPIATKQRFGKWGELMKAAAQHSNFHVKISGMGTTSGNGADWSSEDIQPYIEFAIEHFGIDRCFCGGDWPVSLLAGTYSRTWQQYINVFSRILKEEDQQKLLSQNAVQFYQL